jgi:hypothetical protein
MEDRDPPFISPMVPDFITPPYCGGLRCCHVSCCLRPHLPVKVGSSAAMWPIAQDLPSPPRRALALLRVPRYQIPPPAEEGSGTTTRPTVPCGPWASSIKKCLTSLAMQLGTCVSKVRSHVSKVCSCVSKMHMLEQSRPARRAGRQHHHDM